MHDTTPSRRTVLALIGAAALLPHAAAAIEALPPVTVHKDPDCGCCNDWIEHLRQSGFSVTGLDTPQLNRIKARLGVPSELASCHTAEIGPYVIEGHVPADAIIRLLREAPKARGLAVPGMPIGSPGMEIPGRAPDTYEVVLFGVEGRRVFARYRGAQEL